MSNLFLKDPDDVLDYKFDFKAVTNGTDGAKTDWLGSAETISTAVITVDSGLTKDSDSITDTNTSVTVWLSGGTIGTTYNVLCHITTSAGREWDQTIEVEIVAR